MSIYKYTSMYKFFMFVVPYILVNKFNYFSNKVYFFVIFIVISLYMFRLTPSSGAQLYPGSHWCVDGFPVLLIHVGRYLPTWINKTRKPSTHQWLSGYSCAPEDGISRNM